MKNASSPSLPAWHYNEFQQVGLNYADPAEVAIYDERHGRFRDFDTECESVLDLLALPPHATVLDIGTGTGTFARAAARRGHTVEAWDVSPAMLAHARRTADAAGLTSIRWHHAGFLTGRAEPASFDGIMTTFALHHLPDLWKGVALARLARALKPAGRLYLHDVIVEGTDVFGNITAMVAHAESRGGPELRIDAEGHFRDEYSTYDWVMDGLFARAGLEIVHRKFDRGAFGTYVATRPPAS